MAGAFHTHTAKGLFFCECGRPDMQMPVVILTTCANAPNQDDWKKSPCKMVHAWDRKDMASTLEADDLKMMQWHVDASFVAHDNVRGHTSGTMTMRKGSMCSKSVKQKINRKQMPWEWMMCYHKCHGLIIF